MTQAETNKAIYEFEERKTAYFNFLFRLQESGVTNMFGAVPYLRQAFPTLPRQSAEAILLEWMENYDAIRRSGRCE